MNEFGFCILRPTFTGRLYHLSCSLSLRCAIIQDVPDGLTQTVHCWGMEGMYVNFYKPFNTTYLMLCEVKVYGGRNPFYQSKSSLVWGWVNECDIWLG